MYEDVWYHSDDGLKLFARDYRHSDSATTLLCMHGLTRNSADFEDLAAVLCGDYRLVVPDQRGRGHSEWDPDPANYTPARYVEDMFTLIGELELEEVVLIGTSMGGLMSMLMVTLKPEIFRAVILNDVGPVVGAQGLARIRGYVGRSEPVDSVEEAIAQVASSNQAAFPSYGQADWARWVHRLYEKTPAGQLTLRYDPAIATPLGESDDNAVPPDPWPLFESLCALPLLTIRGELSDILEPDCLAEMGRRHGSMATLIVPGVGHAPMLDEEGVVAAIEAFLAGGRDQSG